MDCLVLLIIQSTEGIRFLNRCKSPETDRLMETSEIQIIFYGKNSHYPTVCALSVGQTKIEINYLGFPQCEL